jgi:hypothetical protein
MARNADRAQRVRIALSAPEGAAGPGAWLPCSAAIHPNVLNDG